MTPKEKLMERDKQIANLQRIIKERDKIIKELIKELYSI